jgi:hypothetical protein
VIFGDQQKQTKSDYRFQGLYYCFLFNIKDDKLRQISFKINLISLKFSAREYLDTSNLVN